MKYFLLFGLLSATQALLPGDVLAQPVLRGQLGGIQQERRVNENTKLIDKTTGKPVSYQDYQQMMKTDRDGYHLEPVFDEYGQASTYKIRSTTAEERETHRFNDRDPALRPQIGQPMPEFVMKGLDEKVYRLSELKGHVIVLSFWISLSNPFWSSNRAKAYADALRPYQSETDPISLGVLHESKETIAHVMTTETLPFIPIPNSYSFHQKFQVTRGPSFIVIDRTGTVAAYLEGSNYDELQKVLQTVSR